MQEKREDIFDVIMSWKLFEPFQPFYRKYKEGLLYLLFGGLTFFLVIGIYAVLDQLLEIGVLTANIVSWLAGVTFSFFTTRSWVFKSKTQGLKALFVQMAGFCAARVATLILQEVLLYAFIVLMGFDSILVKVCSEVINIILNYLASKFLIFRK